MSSNNKILCALSGGVDSSVAALILKKKGFNVIGIFMNFWNDQENDKNYRQNKCCSVESARSARMIASKLKIKLYELNFKDIFKKKVVNYFIQGYEKGITPNPCVVCNYEIKFGKLLHIARDLKAKKIATGHYARVIMKDNRFGLYRGIDKIKDQSYFLWRIPASILPSVEFPVGGMNKDRVRKLAKLHKLETYNKKDSQGLCFVGKSKVEFISKFAKRLSEPGNVVDKFGKIIGQHNGLAFYTVGQREGFSITNDEWRNRKLDVPPLYVIKLIPTKNLLVVGEDKDTYSQSMVISGLNWLDSSYLSFKGNKLIWAQIRYQNKANKCRAAYLKKNRLKIEFKKPQRAVTPGQSCVFYDRDKVLGGGFIMQNYD